MAELAGARFLERGREKIDELVERGFGVLGKEGLSLSVSEALYLLRKGRVEARDEKGEVIGFDALMGLAKKRDALAEERLAVYSHLRENGHVAKIAKEGEEYFRVYRKGKRVGDEPSKYLVKVVDREWRAGIGELEDELRKASALRKELVLAFVREEGSVAFVAVGRASFE